MFEGSERRRVIETELVNEIRTMRLEMTSHFGRLMGRMVNDVLAVETVTFGTSGVIARDYRVPVGAIEVTNHADGTDVVTVVSDGPTDTAPASGIGVYVVPITSTRTIAIGGHQVTLYGTSGEKVSFQVFASQITPSA